MVNYHCGSIYNLMLIIDYGYFFQNALAITKGIQPSSLSQQHALAMRPYTAYILSYAAQHINSKEKCDMVGCPSLTGRQGWIGCDVCRRWFHQKCAHATSNTTSKDYMCVICKAQYA